MPQGSRERAAELRQHLMRAVNASYVLIALDLEEAVYDRYTP